MASLRLVICVALVAIGIWLTLDGTYVAAILVPLGILGIKFFLKMATQRTELYEQGFVSKNIFGGVRGRYADLKSICAKCSEGKWRSQHQYFSDDQFRRKAYRQQRKIPQG